MACALSRTCVKTCKGMCEDLEANDANSGQARDALDGLVEDHGFDNWVVVAKHWMTSCGGSRRGMGTASGGAEHAEHSIVGAMQGELS